MHYIDLFFINESLVWSDAWLIHEIPLEYYVLSFDLVFKEDSRETGFDSDIPSERQLNKVVKVTWILML